MHFLRLIEHFNQTLTAHLVKLTNDSMYDCDIKINSILFGYWAKKV